ncbi:MAG: ROK family protein [Candidatus Nanoarchaeia archaeon]|nr:ROK family protein [Candidatus Nanoarchaeia archaeon]MDD5741057.1 ROK family protein [Candidatus Nanoarchaeia archaeon]
MSKIIAVDLGGTNLRVALLEGNKILKYIKKNTPKEKEALIAEMEDSISQLITKDVKGIGVGSPGPLKNGVIQNPPNLPLKNYNLKKELETKFKKRVVVENDAKCVALSEAKFGCKKKNFIILTLGTGIGGGVIMNHELYRGMGNGGELGHMVLDDGKWFEDLWKESKEMMKKSFGKEIFIKDLTKMNSPESNEILDHIVKYLSQGIASLMNIFDPEIIILMGGAREAGEPFLNIVRKDVKKYKIIPRDIPIKWSKQEHPGIMGAGLLVR